jgi:RHS repeat-associated protein
MWDGASRLVGIDNVTLAYNGLNDLVARVQGGVTTRYFYNYALELHPIVAEKNETTGQFTRYYVWSPEGRLLYLIDAANGNAVRYFHFDRNGSTLALTDSSGTVTDAYTYSPSGVLLLHTGTNTQPFTFIGARGLRTEPAGGQLYQMRARYFDPSTARFLSPDSVWPDLYRPARLNPYQYAMRSPLRFFDPSGNAEVDLQYVSDDVSVFGYLFSGDWFSSLDDLIDKIKKKLGPDDCIRTLTIVNHGSKGVRGFIQFDSENYVCKNPNGRTPFSSPETEAKLRELQKLFCKDGSVIFRICRAGEGEEGDIALKAIANVLKVPVQGPEDEIKAAPWGGITVSWKTVMPDGYVPPDRTSIAAVTGETKAALK